MSVFFCVLGSGSTGNSALLITPDAHVLIDIGFQPDVLAERLDGTGASWESLDAVVLTHVHDDHIKRRCMVMCARHEVQFFCHEVHAEQLRGTRGMNSLRSRGLLRTYSSSSFEAKTVRFHPVELPHDSPPTFGFRIETKCSQGRERRLGYFADLGECGEGALEHMRGLDLLALEFNHDEHMERTSGRHPRLIQRILGRNGHLSNKQAAEVLRQLVESAHPPPKVLVQMHLSRACNRAELAYQAAQEVLLLSGASTRVYSSRQERRGTVHRVDVDD